MQRRDEQAPIRQEEGQEVTSGNQDALVALCRADPNAFIEFVSGYTQGQLHLDLQQFISDYDSTYIELPRGHGKTDQFIYRDAWEIGHDPNILIKIVKATDDEAVAYVSAVQSVLESPAYRMVFPEIEPDKREWGKTSLRVKRSSMSKDSTIAASGIFGNPGGRADILRFDDICTLKNSVHSATTRERVKEEANNTWTNMVKKGGKIHRIGTPWHISDITADWRRNSRIHVMRRACVGTTRSPWPEYWTPEMLLERKEIVGDIAYSRAYLLQPITGDELVFSPETLLRYGVRVDQRPKTGGRIIAAIDLAFRRQNQIVGTRKTNPDYSVVTIARITGDGHVYPLRMVRLRTTFPDFRDLLKKLTAEYSVERVLTEEVGPMVGLNDQLALDLKVPVVPLKRNTDKHLRAIEVQGVFQQGRFHIPLADTLDSEGKPQPHPDFLPMYDEMVDFPFGDHDDTVDTAIDLMGEAKNMLGQISHSASVYNPYLLSDILRANEDRERKAREAKEEAEEPEFSSRYFDGQ